MTGLRRIENFLRQCGIGTLKLALWLPVWFALDHFEIRPSLHFLLVLGTAFAVLAIVSGVVSAIADHRGDKPLSKL